MFSETMLLGCCFMNGEQYGHLMATSLEYYKEEHFEHLGCSMCGKS